jgi:hypothetical protein
MKDTAYACGVEERAVSIIVRQTPEASSIRISSRAASIIVSVGSRIASTAARAA